MTQSSARSVRSIKSIVLLNVLLLFDDVEVEDALLDEKVLVNVFEVVILDGFALNELLILFELNRLFKFNEFGLN